MSDTIAAERALHHDDPDVSGVILPDQLREGASLDDTPEKRLVFAVLLDAMMCLRNRHSSAAREVQEWIASPSDGDTPFSFRNVCEVLGFEPAYLVAGIRGWCAQQCRIVGRARPARGLPVRRLYASRPRVIARHRRRHVA